MTAAGYVLGHSHKGRAFPASVHGKFASILFIPMAAQLVLGVYLKLHINERSLRPWAVRAHGVVGKSYPILAWTQFLFGAIAFRGYCRGDDLGQCLAHYIMVSDQPTLSILILNGNRGAGLLHMALSWQYFSLRAKHGSVAVDGAQSSGILGSSLCGE